MPELYPGQTEVVADKLRQCELIMQANQEKLKTETDPEKRASLLRLIAGQSGTIGAYKRQLQKCQTDSEEATARTRDLKIRLSEQEYAALDERAQSAGQTMAQYIRSQCGL